MKSLNIEKEFSDLKNALSSLSYGKKSVNLAPVILPNLPSRIELINGEIEIPPSEIDHDEKGRAIYADSLVLVYIKDQGGNLEDVIAGDIERGKKIHLRRCATVEDLEVKGRGDRYHAIIRDDGFFPVYQQGYTSQQSFHLGRLRVCLNCLKELGIDVDAVGAAKKTRAATFNFGAYLNGVTSSDKLFGCEYSKPDLERFPEEKKLLETKFDKAGISNQGSMSESWAGISRAVRAKADWCCQDCSVKLVDNQSFLHVHHVNGNKADNRPENLEVVCVLCHAEKPDHGHMHVTPDMTETIFKHRRLSSS